MAVTGTRFSIVSAVHNVARYLPDYIASIEAQTFPLDRVRVVAVDDGSDDESRAVLEDWARRRPELVTVLPKQNGGQGSARNLGVQHATGEWVTFLDPDDAIVADYLEIVDRTIAASPGLSMVATNRIFLDDATGERRDTHPLRRMFADGDRVVDLDLEPDHFHGSAPAAFVRRDVLIEHGIVFDDRIRPNFEDGAFCSRYLLASGTSQVAFLQSARYLYRKRADGTSTLQGSLRDPARFTSVPRHGYLSLLRDAAPEGWYAPEWLQQFVLYEIYGYFKSDAAMSNSFSVATGDVGAEFIDILREIAQYLDPRVVESTKTEPVWRDILQHLDSERWVTPYAVVTRYDQAKRLARVVYRYRGPAPHETFVCLGEPTPVRHGKVRRITFFGHTLLHERIAWIPVTTTTRLLLDGTAVPLRHDWADAGQTTMRRHALRSPFLPAGGKRDLGREDELLLQLAGSRAVRKLYRNAWVIMDRVVAAGDNGERLFRHLRDHRKDINAWFVIDKDAPEWDKLKADGYDHLVAYGSRRWKLLMLNCAHLVASHTERAVRRPPEILRLTEPTWTFTFLQHGVIKDDLSRWLNPKPIDVFVTSTPGEYESIAGDGSPYVFTGKEVTLSGLPRFDRLRELANAATDRNLVLVCPTWRIWLSPDYDGISQRAVVADFADSEYAQAWLGFLRDESLRDTLAAQGLRLGFLPHPNIQPVLRELDLPDWVEPMSHDDHDVQELIARTALMVTDYSSMSFNAGYVDTPVVYYQFDADRVFGGGHIGVEGYYDYERDGFGPVTTTLADTVSAVSDIVTASGRAAAAEYTERFARTFPHRDGRCCERVTAAIEALTDKS